jgi:ABC-type multidrug transport system permease subunit
VRFAFVQGWIVPHLLLAGVWLFALLGLPRLWPRFRVAVRDGRLAVAIAFGMPIIVYALRFAIRMELHSYSPKAPALIYLKWALVGGVLITAFTAAVCYVLRVVEVEDRFSFAVLCAVVLCASVLGLGVTFPSLPER